MKYFYKCFEKTICLHLFHKPTELLIFWLKRFCPGIIEINSEPVNIDFHIHFIKSNKINYITAANKVIIYGHEITNESFIAKFVTQCFQKMLIDEDILIIPAACVANNDRALLILGDFWQGKTSTAMAIIFESDYNLVSDNYVAIKNGCIIGATKYISVRKENFSDFSNSVYFINDRYFLKNCFSLDKNINVDGFLLPYINEGDHNVHTISREESKWYLYQKFSRLFCGETILFDGALASPVFLNKSISRKILLIVNKLLEQNEIRYVSASIDEIKAEGRRILNKRKTRK